MTARKVLIFDARPAMRILIGSLLSGIDGYQAFEAHDMPQIADCLKDGTVDVIIVAASLSLDSALATVAEIRACPQPRAATVPIILVNASLPPTPAGSTQANPADRFLRGPVTARALREQLDSLFQA